ncbi:MAG: amino acid ABC transporter substrate-binding protein [Succinivibrio sp.]|nr:amino acid ABC transporter substrate-binding protein [Succinivibrio sp.]
MRVFWSALLLASVLLTEPVWSAEMRVLRVVTEATNPPFEFKDEQGSLVGFDLDLLEAMARAGNFTIELAEVPFAQILPMLLAGDADVGAAGFFITTARKEQVAFSEQYIRGGLTAAIGPIYVDSIQSARDLEGKNICVHTASLAEQLAKSIKRAQVLSKDTNEEVAQSFNDGECAVAINERLVMLYHIKTGTLQDAVLLPDLLSHHELGFALREDDKALKELIDGSLEQIRKDGTYSEIFNKWFSVDVQENRVHIKNDADTDDRAVAE